MGGEQAGKPFFSQCLYWFSHQILVSSHKFTIQGIDGLNYDDPIKVVAMIPANWWLENKSCKYILSVLVHKDNKDIITNPSKQPPGLTRKKVREKSKKLIADERAVARLDRPVEVVDGDGAVKAITSLTAIDARERQIFYELL
jgi:hypothetical protein